MYKHVGQYFLKKAKSKILGKLVKAGFWTLVVAFPGPMITTLGVSGLAATAVTLHSGVVEFGMSLL